MTLLEIYPPACLLVVGPQVAIATGNTTESSSNGNEFPYSYRATVEAGMRAAVEALPPDTSEEEKKWQQRLLRDAYDLDPTLAAYKVTEILKERGCYANWMKKTIAEHIINANPVSQPNATLQHLLNLQSNGALLACTQYDTCLDSAAGTDPVLMEEEERFQKWADGGVGGFLHLHGIFSKPSTVQLDGVNYVKYLSESNPASYNTLREIFRKRTVVFVGYDSNYFDPLILTFLKVVYPDDSVLRNPPILLACDVPHPLEALSLFLLFQVSKKDVLRLEDTVSPGSEKNFAIGKGLEKPSDGLKVQAFLLFEEKQSFRKLGDIIYQQNKSGEIYVRRDALTVIYGEHILYGNLVTYGRSGLRQLWNLVFGKGSPLHRKGLLALGLLNAVIVWPRRKPSHLGCVTGINSVHAYAMTKQLPSIPPLAKSKPSSLTPDSTLTSKETCEKMTTSSESVHPAVYPINVFTALNTLGQPLQVVQGNGNVMVAANQLAASPITRVASVKPQTNSYDLNTHLQMISQLQNQSTSTVLPQQDGQYPFIAPQPPKYCLALPPEVLSAVPPYLIRFQNQLNLAEHTIECIDQLVTPWSSMCNSSNEQQSSRNNSHQKSESAAEVGLMSPRRSSNTGVESFQVGEIPSAFQRVTKSEEKKRSASEASQQSSSESLHVASRCKSLVSSPTPLQLIPSSQTTTSPLVPSKDLRLSPQVLVSPTTVVPQMYPTCMVLNQQPLSYCMVVSPQQATAAHPMLVMNPPTPVQVPQTASLSSPTGQPVMYLLPDGRCISAMPLISAQPSPVSSIQATTSSSPVLDSGKTQATKRPTPPSNSDSPALSLPPLKRSKRSNSLPNILQPLPKSGSRNTKGGECTSAILKTLPVERAKDSSHSTPLPNILQPLPKSSSRQHSSPSTALPERLLQREEGMEGCEQITGTPSGSDTETASSDHEVDEEEEEEAPAFTPTTANKGNIQLWEFLLELLLAPDHGSIIQWTGSSYEFCIVNPGALANLWGTHRNKPRMTYEKLSRALRYYYSKGIMEKVPGKRLTYKFLFDIQKYVIRNQARTISIS